MFWYAPYWGWLLKGRRLYKVKDLVCPLVWLTQFWFSPIPNRPMTDGSLEDDIILQEALIDTRTRVRERTSPEESHERTEAPHFTSSIFIHPIWSVVFDPTKSAKRWPTFFLQTKPIRLLPQLTAGEIGTTKQSGWRQSWRLINGEKCTGKHNVWRHS